MAGMYCHLSNYMRNTYELPRYEYWVLSHCGLSHDCGAISTALFCPSGFVRSASSYMPRSLVVTLMKCLKTSKNMRAWEISSTESLRMVRDL